MADSLGVKSEEQIYYDYSGDHSQEDDDDDDFDVIDRNNRVPDFSDWEVCEI